LLKLAKLGTTSSDLLPGEIALVLVAFSSRAIKRIRIRSVR
jgi:hypothetical protein